MKTKHLFLPILTGVLFAAAAHANEDITITGSTACRKILYDRLATLFDPGFTQFPSGALAAGSANTVTVSGTMSAVGGLGATPVTIRLAMSGSAQGLKDLNNSTALTTLDPVGGTNVPASGIPFFAFADNFPEACSPPIAGSQFTANTNLMVLPFVLFKNLGANGMGNVTNITKEQAVMLMTSSGIISGFPAMGADFLGGSTTGGPVFLFGRDSGSGTRISVLRDIGFTGAPRQYATNSLGDIVNSTLTAGSNNVTAAENGFGSGGTLCKVVASPSLSTSNIIGYASETDAGSGNGITSANWISYEGVSCTHDTVKNGRYPIWCYEHIYAKAGTLSGNKLDIYNGLVAALTNPGYQATNALFTNNAVALGEMKVKRGVDGGSFTTTPVAGF